MRKTKTSQPHWITNLRILMEAKGMNPRSLSLQSGLNPTAVRDMLEGRTRFPRYDTALSLSNCLGVTPSQLMGTPIDPKSIKTKASTTQEAANDDDLELLTEIITRLHEVAEEYSHDLKPRDLAAMTTTLYRQLQGDPKRTAQDLKPRLIDLMAYESLRRSKTR